MEEKFYDDETQKHIFLSLSDNRNAIFLNYISLSIFAYIFDSFVALLLFL